MKSICAFAVTTSLMVLPAQADVSKQVLESITTPDMVDTSIGALTFTDGVPTAETTQRIYDYLDTMRGVDAFLKGMPGASVQALIKGSRGLGAKQAHQVLIMDRLMDSRPLFLTGNTSTLYVLPTLDLKRDGPTVLEAPPGMLGAFNDAWFRYLQDIGPAGPDEGIAGAKLFSQITLIPRTILWPSVLVFSIIGSYAAASSFFDVWVMAVAGIVGYFMLRFGFGPAPLIMGLVLGPIVEENFSKAMIVHDNSVLSMMERPLVLLFFALTLLSLAGPVRAAIRAWRDRKRLVAMQEGE